MRSSSFKGNIQFIIPLQHFAVLFVKQKTTNLLKKLKYKTTLLKQILKKYKISRLKVKKQSVLVIGNVSTSMKSSHRPALPKGIVPVVL